jgi:aspartate-semialdehyde dehydrogenase
MIEVAILGATGLVGQKIVKLLDGHPWFNVIAVAASERNVGRKYRDAVKYRVQGEVPSNVADQELVDIKPKAMNKADVIFSALPAEIANRKEEDFAQAGKIVVSNASAHRMDPDVPLLNPEINSEHLDLIDDQRRKRKWDGAIVTNPNCSTTILSLSLKPIYDKFGVVNVFVSTMQALSGAGFPGVASLDILDNTIPFIRGEEEKMEYETPKILGSITEPANFKVSASCHRVPVVDGHMEAVFLETKQKASVDTVIQAMEDFSGYPQKLGLPSAPPKPIVVKRERDRPQTKLDRLEGRGMSITVGRIRREGIHEGIKYIVLGHNIIRGAAGCSVLNAELLKSEKYI